jgi:CRISPR type II-A-associated protein Csn2
MKLMHPFWETAFEFDGDAVKAVVVESQELYSEFLSELSIQIQGESGVFVLSDNGKTMSIKGNVCLIFNPFVLSQNEKQILTGVYSELVAEALGEDKYVRTNEVISELCSFMNSLALEVDVMLHVEAPSINDVVKVVAPYYEENYDSLVERVCSYMDAAVKYTKVKLFVFVHLLTYISDIEYEVFLKHVLYQKYNVMLFESSSARLSGCEDILIIDEDLCEIRSQTNKSEI